MNCMALALAFSVTGEESHIGGKGVRIQKNIQKYPTTGSKISLSTRSSDDIGHVVENSI